MIIVNYKSKRQLKKAIGEILSYDKGATTGHMPDGSFFVENGDRTFRATVTMKANKIVEVR